MMFAPGKLKNMVEHVGRHILLGVNINSDIILKWI